MLTASTCRARFTWLAVTLMMGSGLCGAAEAQNFKGRLAATEVEMVLMPADFLCRVGRRTLPQCL